MSEEKVPHIWSSTGLPERVHALNRVFERGADDVYRTEGSPLRFALVEEPGQPCSRRLVPTSLDEDAAIPPLADGETRLEYCLNCAMWEPSWSNGGGGIVQAYGNNLRRQSAAWYAKNYLEKHGRPPEGVHYVWARYGPEGSKAHIKTLLVTLTTPFARCVREAAVMWYAEHHQRRLGRLPEGRHRVVVSYGPPGEANVVPPGRRGSGMVELDVTYPSLAASASSS